MVRTVAKTRFKDMECRGGCGRMLRVGSNTRKKPQCLSCGIKIMVDNQRQLHEHSGPYYDKWRKAMRRWADVHLSATGGTP